MISTLYVYMYIVNIITDLYSYTKHTQVYVILAHDHTQHMAQF